MLHFGKQDDMLFGVFRMTTRYLSCWSSVFMLVFRPRCR